MSASRLDTQLAAELADIAAAGLTRRRRVLDSPAGRIARVDAQEVLNFASNDYLGLAGNAEIAQALADGALRWGAGSGASHLVSGHLTPHDQLENEIAAFTGFERALTFSTGYLAKLAVTPTLAGRGGGVFADKLDHASLVAAETGLEPEEIAAVIAFLCSKNAGMITGHNLLVDGGFTIK